MNFLLILLITTNFAGSHTVQVPMDNIEMCEKARVQSKKLIGGEVTNRITDVRGVCLEVKNK